MRNTINLEIAKKLYELNFSHDCTWYWHTEGTSIPFSLGIPVKDEAFWGHLKYPAFTTDELGKILPAGLHKIHKNGAWFDLQKSEDNKWIAGYGEDKFNYIEEESDTMADAMGKILIYLIENNLINPPTTI